ncbi:hypothetical protein HYDPIDRAFT_112381 [Hydnomerulius pinastri MD-312]|uniref:Anaphase-promoting complex subunit 4-like WD40 domain-containing protein n=1 Tax=Hydnomerulius pinastri MD-312 TaxID=994086 RepID=A0A0C9WF00_9AGAM|nr:hypothetical protein HYDPIDRAFT_112381 [Hydnomerulius pinastri MD-312]
MSTKSTESVDRTMKPILTIAAQLQFGVVQGIAYLPGGERVVTCSRNGAIRVWNTTTGEEEGAPMDHGDRVDCVAVTKDGKRIMSGGPDKLVKVWDVETHEVLEEWSGHESSIESMTISPDDELVASGDMNGMVIIREARGGKVKHFMRNLDGNWGASEVKSLCFSPNGEKVALAHNTGTLRIFEVATGDLVLGPMYCSQTMSEELYEYWPWHWAFTSLPGLWSLDGRRFFSASDGNTIRTWDTETGDPVGEPWRGHEESLCRSPSPLTVYA